MKILLRDSAKEIIQITMVDYAETAFGVQNPKNSVYAIWKSSKNAVVW